MASLSIIFEDDYLLVIDKPPGIAVTEEGVKESEITISKILSSEYKITAERSGIVHRLDKDTSGLLLVAKNNEIAQNLKLKFQNREIKKTYLCLVHGSLNKTLSVKGSILRNPKNRFKFTVDDEGRESETEFKPLQKFQISNLKFKILFKDLSKKDLSKLKSYNQFTLLECHPLTGRTHQIRVHLKYINLPIVGDDKYAGRKTARLDKKWCPRQFLHAAKLEFDHPLNNKSMVFESFLPDDLKKSLSFLENE